MAELTSFSQANASVFDSYLGKHIEEVFDGPNGRYRWGNRLRVAGCALRPTINAGNVTWSIISDAEHSPQMFNAASGVGSGITVGLARNIGRVVSAVAAPDESLQSHGLILGCSFGLSQIQIGFSWVQKRRAILTSNGTAWTISGNAGWIASATHGAQSMLTLQTNIYGANTVESFSSVALYLGRTVTALARTGVRVVNSGIGNHQTRFEILDDAGLAVVPAAGDVVFADCPKFLTSPPIIGAVSAGSLISEAFTPSFANIWLMAAYLE
jgi:hypothetical protein